jgi:hypothetical protein
MEKLVDLTEKAFLGEFIKLSPKVNELSEILWFVFRMGGSVTHGIITPRFPDADGDIRNLIEMGILREMDAGKERIVAFSDGFEGRLLSKNLSDITVNDIFDILVDTYPKEVGKRYKLNDLMNRLSTVMAAIITHATPEEPAFLNKVFRAAGEDAAGSVTSESLNQSKDILEYYLHKYLGLVQPVGSFAVNLSGKAAQIVARNPELSGAYKSPRSADGEKKPTLVGRGAGSAGKGGD